MAVSYNTRTKIDISGIEELNKKFKQINSNLKNVLPKAALAGAVIVKSAAQQKARKKSGALADGIEATITWDKNAPVAWAATGMDKNKNNIFVKHSKEGKRYYYPASIEYGHPEAPAYPFMRPAMDENKTAVRNAVKNQIKALIDKGGG